ncbi:MAG: hypothetical protein ABEK50_01810 [bacterium]
MKFFSILLSLLAGGTYLMLHRISLDRIGPKFYRLITTLSLIGFGLILLTLRPAGFSSWTEFGLVVGILSTGLMHHRSLSGTLPGLRPVFYWTGVGLILTFFAAIVFGPTLSMIKTEVVPTPVAYLQIVLSAAVLGSIVDAMICGHWYLVNPDLSLEPIQSISRALTLVILAKIALISWVLFQTKLHNPFLFEQLMFYKYPLLFWVRLLVGLAGGLFFNWMSWKALEHGNTQASTGILYACITWIIMGEFSAFYLTVVEGVPL